MFTLKIDFIVYLLITSASVATVLNVWFKTLLPVHLINSIFKPAEKLYTDQDLENYYIEKLEKYSIGDFSLAELLRCYICFSMWITLLVTLALTLWFGIPVIYVPWLIICTPCFAHIIYGLK